LYNNTIKSSSFWVYVKCLTEGVAGGVGVSKFCRGKEGQANPELLDFEALIEGFDLAAPLDLKKIFIVTDNSLLYQFVSKQTLLVTSFCVTNLFSCDVVFSFFFFFRHIFVRRGFSLNL
ncbi:Unknown protein, partial [Striga hermonthica]